MAEPGPAARADPGADPGAGAEQGSAHAERGAVPTAGSAERGAEPAVARADVGAEPGALLAPPPPPGLRPGPAPRISVLVPAYRAAWTIGAALDSALAQDPPPFEIVVSDDGSDDDLDAALAPYAGRIRLVRGPNAGLATARNRAAAVARGDLLALLDADDVWLPGRTAALTAAAVARPDLAVLTTDAVVVGGDRTEPERYYATRAFPVTDQEIGILTCSFVFGAGSVRSAAFRTVGGYRAGARFAEDWDLWLRLLLRGHRAGMVPVPLYEYRRGPGTLTAQRVDLALGVLDVLAGARPLTRGRAQRRRLRATEQEWRERAARDAGRLGDPRSRSLAVRAALAPAAAPRARVRFGVAAALPPRTVARLAEKRAGGPRPDPVDRASGPDPAGGVDGLDPAGTPGGSS